MVNRLTSSPEINLLLDQFLGEIQAVLSSRLVGLYLHGSLAYGGFDPQTSDIDFLVVTWESLTEDVFAALKEMHSILRSGRSAWAQKLEGAYLPKEFLRCHDPAHAPIPWLGADGHFAWERLGSDWIIQRWTLREHSLPVFGPPLKDMIDPVSPDDIREAVRCSLQEWWAPPFPSPERFQEAGYRVYAVLTMCRSLFVLKHGRVASKPEAAIWVMNSFGEPWRSLAAKAMQWRPGMEFNQGDELFALIHFTLKKWGLMD